VLIECVGPPETLVARRARVLAPSLVKLILVTLPIEFPLERLVA
jgi:hypothetical protein